MGNETQTSQSNKEENEVLERQYAESYIASRLEKVRDYYDNRADGYRKRYMSNQTWIIVCGAIIPIVTLLNETFECCPVFKCWHLGSILNAVIAAVIAIIAGIDKLHPKPMEHHSLLRANAPPRRNAISKPSRQIW